MDSMKEVEAQEIAAEKAKEEAAVAGLDIYSKVEELQRTLARAKEANDMVVWCSRFFLICIFF